MVKSSHGNSESEKGRELAHQPTQAVGNGTGRAGARGTKKAQAITNPHGANQYKLDPRQALFLSYYLDPKSQSFGVATKSAVLAGYEQEYAENIMSKMPTWLSVKVEEFRSNTLLEKAERNINKYLEMETRVQAMGAFGPIFEKVERKKKVTLKNGKIVERKVVEKVPVIVESGKLLEIQQKTSHFVAERLGRKRFGRDVDDTPKPTSIVHMTQIVINAPAQK